LLNDTFTDEKYRDFQDACIEGCKNVAHRSHQETLIQYLHSWNKRHWELKPCSPCPKGLLGGLRVAPAAGKTFSDRREFSRQVYPTARIFFFRTMSTRTIPT
jgi:hypothetical protein